MTAPLAAPYLTSSSKNQRQPSDLPTPSRFRSSVSNGCREQLYAVRERESIYISITKLLQLLAREYLGGLDAVRRRVGDTAADAVTQELREKIPSRLREM